MNERELRERLRRTEEDLKQAIERAWLAELENLYLKIRLREVDYRKRKAS